MAEMEIKRVLTVDTVPAIKSLKGLADEVNACRKEVDRLDEEGKSGTQEYQEALVDLKGAQQDYNAAVRMSVKEAGAAKGSYNELTVAMAKLKDQWKATSDAAERAALGKQIKSINDQLKALDASTGNYQRNVGDYTNAMKAALGDMPQYADAVKKPLKAVNDQMALLGKQPVLGMIALLTPLITKIAEELKESGKATELLAKVTKSLEPVMGFLQGVLEKITDLAGVLIERVLEFTQGGLFQRIIQGVVGVGNAIVNFVVAPFKGIIAAVKEIKDKGVKGLGDAARAFGAEMKQGVAFKANYEAGQVMATTIAEGVRSKKKDIANAVVESAKEAKLELDKNINYGEDDVTREALERIRQQAETDKAVLEDIAAQEKVVAEQMAAYYKEMADAQDALAAAEQRRRQTVVEGGKAIESVLGSVAQAWNNELQAQLSAGRISEAQARRRFAFVKAFQLAQAVLNTASGIASVFSAPDNITMTQKWLQAAAVGAQGLAQIATIKGATIGTGAMASEAQAVTQLATAGAPAPPVQTIVPITRVGTNAEDEERLADYRQAQRVYVVYSDIAQAGQKVAVQAAESTF